VQRSAAPDVSPLNAQCLDFFIDHPQIMLISVKIKKRRGQRSRETMQQWLIILEKLALSARRKMVKGRWL